jgi:hypothetical protein
MPENARIIPGDQWFARIEFLDATEVWRPLKLGRQDFDDIHQNILLQRGWQDEESGLRQWVWSAKFQEPVSTARLRINVAARGGFPGLQVLL